MSTTRQPGYYAVKYKGTWEFGKWTGFEWYIAGKMRIWNDSFLDEIHPTPLDPQPGAGEQEEKEYQFLYWEDYLNCEEKDKPFAKLITATSVEEACRKFLEWKPESVDKVDYEVRVSGKDYDISEMPGFLELI